MALFYDLYSVFLLIDSYIGTRPILNRSKDATPIVVKETVATALVDGDNIWGPVVGYFCMDLAIKKAKEAGIGWVSARGDVVYKCGVRYCTHKSKGDNNMAEEWIVSEDEVVDFCTRCFVSLGVGHDHAHLMGEMMVTADKRGHYSHGLNRLDSYIGDWLILNRSKDATPIVVKETVATALVDGDNIWGPVVGYFCMDLAIKKAKEAGIVWVSARGCNHFGISGLYSSRAMEQGMIGMSFTNATPNIVPTRAKEPVLGTNPISVAAPAENGDSFMLDMATSVVSLGKVEIQDRKNESIPGGWGMDAENKPSSSAKDVLESGKLFPLGGREETSGYKGYGLAMMVEIFCGVLSGSHVGPEIRHWTHDNKDAANLGQCYVAIDPNAFAPGFTDRMGRLISQCRQLQPGDGESEVLVPGDPERKHTDICEKLGGVPYHDSQIKFADDIAARLGVKPLVRRQRPCD